MRERRRESRVSGGAARFRRRRLTAVAVVGVLAVVVAAVVVSLSLGSGGEGARYVLGGTVGTPTVATAATGTHNAPVPHSVFKPRPAAVALAARLPLDRQVAQLFMVGVGGTGASGVTVGAVDWGGFVLGSSNFVGAGQVSSLISALNSAVSSGGVTPLIAALQEGGPATAFKGLPPQGESEIAAAGAPTLAGAQASLAGKRLLALGVNMTLAPLADVDTPGGPLDGRLFGTDPGLVARFSLAAVRGYASAGMIAAVGHFPGTGDASADPEQMMATVGGSLASLRARDLVPFAAVTAEAPVILMSNAVYAAFDGVTPAGLLRQAVDLLRNDYGFGGTVMSGDLDAAIQATGGDAGTAALQALNAGDDLLFAGGPASEQQAAYSAVLAAARGSAAVRARVHDALLHVLSLKVRFGLVR